MFRTLFRSFLPGGIPTGLNGCYWRCVNCGGYRRTYRLSISPRADYIDVLVEFDSSGGHPVSAEICGWSEVWKTANWEELANFLLDRSKRDRDYNLQWTPPRVANIVSALRGQVNKLAE